MNTSVADIYTILASAIYKDGQQTTTAAIPFAQGIQTDTIAEKTSATGVTIDSVLLKDGRIDTTKASDVASAGTVNLETATGNLVDITGTTTITAVTLSEGHWRIARFTGALTLTHGASLILPGSANITTAAGDFALFFGYASSVVRVAYFKVDGTAVAPFVDTNPIAQGSSDGTKRVRLEVDGLTTATTRVLTVQDQDGTLAVMSDVTGLIRGLTLTNDTDTDHDIQIATGAARDATDAITLTLSSVLTKQIDASWAVGDDQGGLDGSESVAGTPDADTWYYVWLIRRSDTGVVDALFSESSSAPTMPTNYDQKRLIGAVRTDGSANIKQFYQDGDWFKWQARQSVLSGGTATSATSVTISAVVPTIATMFSTNAVCDVGVNNNQGTNSCVVGVATSVDYAVLAYASASTTQAFTLGHTGGGGETDIPNTGTFEYRNVTGAAGPVNPTSSIWVTGFKLAR